MSDAPRYASLQDYLRVLGRQRLVIAVVTLAFIAAAVALSVAQTPQYSASASLSFRDPLQDLGAITLTDASLDELPVVRSAQQAEVINRPEVSRRAEKQLDTTLTAGQLAASVSATIDTSTNLVTVTGQSSDPQFAADLTNAFAEAARAVGSRETDRRLRRTEESLREQIRRLQGGDESAARPFQIAEVQNQLLRVNALRQITEPVRVVRRATVPGAPFAPQTTRNIILGGLVGVFFGLLGAFLRDSFDRRLHSAQEVHDELGLPVLGRVPETAFGFAGLAQNGALRMVDADFEAFRVLRMNLNALGPDSAELRTLVVTSGVAEEGKSTVSMSLASAIAIAGQRVLLVECDLRRPSFARRMRVNGQPGLSDYLLGDADPQEILQAVTLTEPASLGNGRSAEPTRDVGSLVCIAAGRHVPNTAELLLSDRFNEFLESVREAYDFVLLDTSPLLGAADALELVPQVDGVLVCVRLQRTTRDSARAARAALDHVPERPTGVVVTGIRPGASDYYHYYYGS